MIISIKQGVQNWEKVGYVIGTCFIKHPVSFECFFSKRSVCTSHHIIQIFLKIMVIPLIQENKIFIIFPILVKMFLNSSPSRILLVFQATNILALVEI